jgi:hypothetical protein
MLWAVYRTYKSVYSRNQSTCHFLSQDNGVSNVRGVGKFPHENGWHEVQWYKGTRGQEPNRWDFIVVVRYPSLNIVSQQEQEHQETNI